LLFCNFDGKIAKLITILEMIGKGLAGLQKIKGEYPSTKEYRYFSSIELPCIILSNLYVSVQLPIRN
jgi:hypothetical protein